MPRKHAKIAFGPGNIDLVDLAREGKLFGRDEIELESGHGLSAFSLSLAGLTPRVPSVKIYPDRLPDDEVASSCRPAKTIYKVKLLRRRVSCLFRPPLRWYRPCRR